MSLVGKRNPRVCTDSRSFSIVTPRFSVESGLVVVMTTTIPPLSAESDDLRRRMDRAPLLELQLFRARRPGFAAMSRCRDSPQSIADRTTPSMWLALHDDIHRSAK